jgi:hypothetical protein
MDENTDAVELAARYMAVWNEPDPDARRTMVRDLWTPGGTHAIETPPAGIRAEAASLGFPAPALEARGHEQIEARVARAYDEFVAPGKYAFRPGHIAWRHAEIVVMTWEMAATGDGAVAGSGRAVLVLDPDGRIRADRAYVD